MEKSCTIQDVFEWFYPSYEKRNSPMHIKIYNEFYDLKKQRDGIQSSIKELNKIFSKDI